MWSVILQILAVTGILILVILGLVLVFLLLVLFFPVRYRVFGKREGEDTIFKLRADWLLGVLRAKGDYPQPGRFTVKLLWLPLFDSAGKPAKKQKKSKKASDRIPPEKNAGEKDPSKEERAAVADRQQESCTSVPKQEDPSCPDSSGQEAYGEEAGILAKITKLKYTIQNLYDKIKEIWQNISYYVELLQAESTSQCLSRAKHRFGKILHHLHPRKCKADIVFGTGSPDTTGYLYGAFCMIAPQPGRNVAVTPDFADAVLSGQVRLAGRITLAVLVWNGLQMFLDEDLKTLIRKCKNGRKENGR